MYSVDVVDDKCHLVHKDDETGDVCRVAVGTELGFNERQRGAYQAIFIPQPDEVENKTFTSTLPWIVLSQGKKRFAVPINKLD